MTPRITVKRAFGNAIIEVNISETVQNPIPEDGLDILLYHASRVIDAAMNRRNCFKYYLACEAKFQKTFESDAMSFAFFTKAQVCLGTSNVDDIITQSKNKIMESFNSFQTQGSGWVFLSWSGVTVKVMKYSPISASRYTPTPELLKGRRCLLNIRNNDDKCFLYCIAASYHKPKNNKTYPAYYRKFFNRFDMTGIETPVKLDDIPRFEAQNGVCVNVFKYSESEARTFIFPLQRTTFKFQKVINLLLVQNGEDSHYILIKSLAALMRLKTKYEKSMHTCSYCFRTFVSIISFVKHVTFCSTGNPVIEMPEESVISFKNYQYRTPNIITIYADLEAYQIKMDEKVTANTSLICEQRPTGFGYIVVSPYPELCKPVKVYRGADAADCFVKAMVEECREVEHLINTVQPMIFTPEDEAVYLNSTVCGICQGALDWDDEVNRVCKDHDHVTGRFRSSAHMSCNLKMQQQKHVLIYFHNAKRYDNHLIIQALADNPEVGRIEVLATTSEKYTRIWTPRFIIHDSMSHLISSLDNLASSLRQRGDYGFQMMRSEFPSDAHFKLALQKLVYPYDYIDGFDRFDEGIPNIDAFYNRLTEEDLPEEEYARLNNACRMFGVQTLGDLHNLYLKIDVLILACVFEDYRRLGVDMFGLDPAYYVSSPSYSFDAMLFTTKVQLELLKSQEMYEFFEAGLRGGCSTIFKRLASANCKNMPNYDHTVEGSTIFYTDCNNLYGYCMQMKLPHNGFRWLTRENLDDLDICAFDVNGSYGLILEVDLKYPVHLHAKHRDFPLAPEKLRIDRDMLGSEMDAFLTRNNLDFAAQTRLTQNLLPKNNYIVHIRNLQFYLTEGLEITAIHRGVIFHQSQWMASYIKTNTEKRINASSKFEKDFFKLLINSVFGKTCENVRKYRSFKIATTETQAKRLIEREQFKSVTVISSNLVICESFKTEVLLNKPIYAGMVILDLAKDHMYKFHYNVMRPLFSGRIELCFSDTDSLCYHIKEADIHNQLSRIAAYMDFSNYDPAHPLYSNRNKFTPGRFKDEVAGDSIIQFCGLRAKSYSMVTLNEQKMAAAGVKRCMQRCLRHVDYVDIIASASLKMIQQNTLISKKHKIYMQQSKRIALSYLDIKRIVLDDGIHTVPYGYLGEL